MLIDYSDDDKAKRDAEPAGEGYTGEPCPHCGRIRVYLRRDGQLACEKCERVWRADPTPYLTERCTCGHERWMHGVDMYECSACNCQQFVPGSPPNGET